MHHSPHLDLDDQLNKQAEAYAKQLAKLNPSELKHSPGYEQKQYGENLYVSCGKGVPPIDPVREW